VSLAVPGSGRSHVRFLENSTSGPGKQSRIPGSWLVSLGNIFISPQSMLCSCLYDLYALYVKPRHTLHTFHTPIAVKRRTINESRASKSNACKSTNASSINFNYLATISSQPTESNKSVFLFFSRRMHTTRGFAGGSTQAKSPERFATGSGAWQLRSAAVCETRRGCWRSPELPAPANRFQKASCAQSLQGGEST
jgi:hypothetical protein